MIKKKGNAAPLMESEFDLESHSVGSAEEAAAASGTLYASISWYCISGSRMQLLAKGLEGLCGARLQAFKPRVSYVEFSNEW